jgi:hypothetical protein
MPKIVLSRTIYVSRDISCSLDTIPPGLSSPQRVSSSEPVRKAVTNEPGSANHAGKHVTVIRACAVIRGNCQAKSDQPAEQYNFVDSLWKWMIPCLAQFFLTHISGYARLAIILSNLLCQLPSQSPKYSLPSKQRPQPESVWSRLCLQCPHGQHERRTTKPSLSRKACKE